MFFASSPPTIVELRPPSNGELSKLMLDEPMSELVNNVFTDNETSTAYLHYYYTLSRNIKRLLYDLEQEQAEQREA